MLIAAKTKAPPGAKNSEARTMGVVSGLGTNQEEHPNHTDPSERIQVLSDRMAAFKRRETAFNAVGWSLYPLNDESFLAVHRKWQLSTVCPDLRSADALLKRIGGAV